MIMSMRKEFFVCLTLSIISALGCTSAKSSSSATNINTAAPALSGRIGACDFTIDTTWGGYVSRSGTFFAQLISIDKKIPRREFSINFECLPLSDTDYLQSNVYVKRITNGSWVLNFDTEPQELREQLMESAHIYDYSRRTPPMLATTIHSTFGDENTRIERLAFCVFGKLQMLCGFSDLGRLNAPTSAVKSEALATIESIRLID
jgi:hypothetical protein